MKAKIKFKSCNNMNKMWKVNYITKQLKKDEKF